MEPEAPPPPELAPIDLQELRLFYEPPGTLRATVDDDRSYHAIKLLQAWPLSHPNRHLSIQDEKGDEVVLIDRLEELSPEARLVAEEELRRRYLTAQVTGVAEIRTEFGVTYWHVRTNKGERDFVVQSLTESCVWLGNGHVLIVDVDGNRFEIPKIAALDEESRKKLDAVF